MKTMETETWADSPIHEMIREAGLDNCERTAERRAHTRREQPINTTMPNDNQTTSESPSCGAACSPRSTVDSAKVKEWMHALPLSPQWDWLREEMAAAIGEPPPDVPEMPNPMADLLGILGDGENAAAQTPPDSGTKDHE